MLTLQGRVLLLQLSICVVSSSRLGFVDISLSFGLNLFQVFPMFLFFHGSLRLIWCRAGEFLQHRGLSI